MSISRYGFTPRSHGSSVYDDPQDEPDEFPDVTDDFEPDHEPEDYEADNKDTGWMNYVYNPLARKGFE